MAPVIGRGPFRHRALCLIALAALVAVAALAGLAVGARAIPPAEIWRALTAFDPTNDAHIILRQLRVPRTVLGILAGAALGIAGAVMQAVTRNPLAEPGLLGINAGAAVAILIGVTVFGLDGIEQYLWLGILGAGLAGIAVFVLGRGHDAGVDPVRLVLAGAGLSVMLGALAGILLINAPPEVHEAFRQWGAGSVAGRGGGVIPALGAALLAGAALASFIAPGLNALALGREVGHALGARPLLTWSLACLCVMLLAGGATAAVGPIGFVGLVAPHLARLMAGADMRWILPFSAGIAALLLLLADILGRIVASPAEVAAGIIATIIGGPFFILGVRRFRMVRL
ncbi:FecCD family ABC transporter permease [Falsirhodobacter algicola]|uniref:Iron chelate uptake ABC transporter family permease subunit n=1 Tax=Falsirhodobacter algicola TaxID=2692330 RepID=A0A8J8MSY7_9RHOB|nr:iron ABC transporter permease [Falsirhodobacter algicola]QUS36150.1 iron chelate uptake ABC transporter family permease subunit [Falsirhodobacter algicola]